MRATSAILHLVRRTGAAATAPSSAGFSRDALSEPWTDDDRDSDGQGPESGLGPHHA